MIKFLLFCLVPMQSRKCEINPNVPDFAYYMKTGENSQYDVFQNATQNASEPVSYQFQFKFDKSQNNVSRSDWSLILDHDFSQFRPEDEKDKISITLKPERSNSIQNLDVGIQIQNFNPDLSAKPKSIKKDQIFKIEKFWDALIIMKIIIYEENQISHFKIFLDDQERYDSANNSQIWTSSDLNLMKVFQKSTFTPKFKFMRTDHSIFDTFYDEKYQNFNYFKMLTENIKSYNIRQQQVEIVADSKNWEFYKTQNYKAIKTDSGQKLILYDNIIDAISQDFQPKSLKDDSNKNEILKIQKSSEIDTGFEIQIKSALTNQIISYLRQNPLSLPISDLIGSQQFNLQFKTQSNTNYPIKVYLQQSEFPFQILSAINQIESQTDTTTVNLDLKPIIGFDPISAVNLVFDLSLDNQQIKDIKSDQVTIKLTNLAMMRKGGSPQCLPSLSFQSIRLVNTFQQVTNGYIEEEKRLRQVFISLAVCMIVISILIIAFTIYKSFNQKQRRLDLYRCREYNSKLQKSEEELRQDRQVKIAMTYVASLEAQYGEKKNPFSDKNLDREAKRGDSEVGLIKKGEATQFDRREVSQYESNNSKQGLILGAHDGSIDMSRDVPQAVVVQSQQEQEPVEVEMVDQGFRSARSGSPKQEIVPDSPDANSSPIFKQASEDPTLAAQKHEQNPDIKKDLKSNESYYDEENDE